MIIAGAGIIGLSCAWRLSHCKIPVTVFDAREPGCEASWAGAGMLAPGGELSKTSPLTRMALDSLAMYPTYVESLRAESGLNIDFRRCGAIEIALSETEATLLDQRAESQALIGIPSEPTRFRNTVHARFFPNDAIVDPRHLINSLRKACAQRGVRIFQNEAVLEILENGSGVRTERGIYKDEGVLIAAGAWSNALSSGFHQPLTEPVRGHLVAWNIRPGTLNTILRRESTYLLQRTSGVLLAGSTTEHVGFDRTIDNDVVAALGERASSLLPELAGMQPSDKWVGFRPGIAGEVPQIGRVADTNVWTAYGHYRNGILLAPDTAERIVRSVT